MRMVLAWISLFLLQAPAAPKPAEQRFADRVDQATLLRDVRELVALGPRMGGTPSGDKAAAYLADAFKRYGLDVETFTDPPKMAHWQDSWQVEIQGRGPLASAWPYGFSPSIEGVRSGKLKVIERLAGSTPDASWRGAIIYTPSEVGRAYPAISAAPFRPLAILTSAPNAPPRYMDASRLGDLPANAANTVPVFALSYNDGRAIAALPAGSPVQVSLVSHVQQGRPKTVVATLPGRDPSRYVLVCAHGDSDSGGPGADDNASGVATTLEIARVLASLIHDGQLAPPEHPIRFAIWGSEYHSTKAYIEREGAKLSQLAAVLNFDETGTGAERDAIYFESNDVPWNRDLLHTLDGVAQDYANRPGFWTEYTTNPSQGGTDSYAFLPKQYQGTGYTDRQIPAVTIYTAAWDHLAALKQTPGWESKGLADPAQLKIDYSRYYHSSGDTPGNTTEREPQNMVRAVKVTGLALLRMEWK